MSIQSECTAPAAGSGTSPKLLRLLRKRLRQLARVTIVLALGLAVAATALAVWWLTSLNRLPDIGDPFDVAEFGAFRISDEQNAMTLVRRAAKKFTPITLNVGLGDPRLRDWFEVNRPLVDLFIQAAERADGIYGPEEVNNWRHYPVESNSGAAMLINMTYLALG
jgi:hypothetical protein